MRTMRPSWTATTEDLGELSNSINCSELAVPAWSDVAAAAAAAGAGGADEPEVPAFAPAALLAVLESPSRALAALLAAGGSAVALAVELDADAGAAGSRFQTTRFPV